MIVSLVAAFQLAATVPALQIESTTSSESTGPVPTMSGKSVTIMAGSNVRVEQVERTGHSFPGAEAGSYMLLMGRTHRMVNVNPASRTWFEIDRAKMQSEMSAMLKSMPGMQMKFSELQAKVEDLGNGEKLLGHPTRHFRIANGLTMNAVMMADSLSITMETKSDTYFATDLKVDDATMAADTSMLTQFGELIPGIEARKLRSELAKLPRLVPLKTVTTTASYFGPMDMTVKITQLVTKVERKQVPASIFEIPAGYKKIEMPSLTAGHRQ